MILWPFLKRFIRLSGAALSGILVLVMAGAIALLLAPRIVGAHLLVVQSQNMEPIVPMGSMVVSLPASSSEIGVGEVITFQTRDLMGGNGVVTHRVVEVIGNGTGVRFKTKGDASEAADLDLVQPGDIVGRMGIALPLLGFLVAGIRSPVGFLLLIGLPAMFLLVAELREIASILRGRVRKSKDSVS